MMKILAVANQKGGVAKTTSAVTIAYVLSVLKHRHVLLVDFDPQGQCATSLAVNPEAGVFNVLVNPKSDIHQWIRESGREGLDILPGDRTTATAQIVMNAENRPIDAIYSILRGLAKEYDFVILDTAPSVGGIQERAVFAADMVLIPTATEFLSMDGLDQMMSMLETMRSNNGWKGTLFGILPTFHDEHTNESAKSFADLNENFGDYVLSPIHRATILRECAAEGKVILEKDPTCRAAREYESLGMEIIKRS